MLIKRKVAVKVIVTEDFRQQLLARLRQALKKVDLSRQELDQQGGRYLSSLEGKDPARADAFRRRLERQKRRQEEVRARLAEELAAAEKLEAGDEYLQGTLEGLAEIQLGDILSEKLHSAELVLRDGRVVEMRNC